MFLWVSSLSQDFTYIVFYHPHGSTFKCVYYDPHFTNEETEDMGTYLFAYRFTAATWAQVV